MRRWMVPAVWVVLAGVLVGACGDGEDEAAGPTTVTTTATTTVTRSAGTSSGGADTGTATPDDGGSTVTRSGTGSATDLPGERAKGPAPGDALSVVAVAHDDTLTVRSGPGMSNDAIAALPPLTDGVIATGRAVKLDRSVWYEVTTSSGPGWASAYYLAYRGSTDDVTSRVVDWADGTPTAATMEELGATVVNIMDSHESVSGGLSDSRRCMSQAPTVGDLGEVTYDLAYVGDYPPNMRVLPEFVETFGWRIHVFGVPTGGGFTLKSVEATRFCSFGDCS